MSPVDDAAAPVLEVRGLTVRYGNHAVVNDVSIEVRPGELVGLIGANGAGKTTTIDAISGFVDHGGSVRLDGRDISSLRPHERARAGIGRTWQAIELFGDLTVRQNCTVSARTPRWTSFVADLLHRPDGADVLARVDTALAFAGLAGSGDRTPSELSHGQQKLVGVARALAGAPQVLLLDEPAAGLDQAESLEFGATLRQMITDTSLSALLIDHDTRLIFEVCDRVYVLDFGEIVASGTAAEVRNDPKVIEAYLGVAT